MDIRINERNTNTATQLNLSEFEKLDRKTREIMLNIIEIKILLFA